MTSKKSFLNKIIQEHFPTVPSWVDEKAFRKALRKEMKSLLNTYIEDGQTTINFGYILCSMLSSRTIDLGASCRVDESPVGEYDISEFVKAPQASQAQFIVSYPKGFDFLTENNDVEFINKTYKNELKSLPDGTVILPKDELDRNDGKALVYKGKAIPLFCDEDEELGIDYGGPVPQFPFPDYPFDKWNDITYITFRWLSDKKYMKDFKVWANSYRKARGEDPVEEFKCIKAHGKWFAMAQ